MSVVSRKFLVPVLLFTCVLVSVSAFTHAYSPVPRSLLFIAAAFGLIVLQATTGRINNKAGMIVLIVILLTTVPAFYWPETRFYRLPIYFIMSILILPTLDKDDIERFVRILSIIMVVMLAGAVIGTFYAYFGGQPLLQFTNEDGRLNQLYLTTLTNFQYQNFIRPAGILDEPGALSYMLCLTASLRHGLGYDKRLTWIILALGFITFSVAHLIFVALYGLENMKGLRRSIKPLIIFIIVLLILALLFFFVPALQDMFELLFLNRLGSTNLGDDRSNAFGNGLKYLNETTFYFGLHPDCATGVASCIDKGYKYYGDNPITMVVHWGIFLSLPYYLTLFFGTIISIVRFDFVLLGTLAILLQRPYVMSLGYSLTILLALYVMLNRSSLTEKKPVRQVREYHA